MNIIRRLHAKAERHREVKDTDFEDGTLYETLVDAAAMIESMSSRDSEAADLALALRECVLKGAIPEKVLAEHSAVILEAIGDEPDPHDDEEDWSRIVDQISSLQSRYHANDGTDGETEEDDDTADVVYDEDGYPDLEVDADDYEERQQSVLFEQERDDPD
jgi:hypothetical protein